MLINSLKSILKTISFLHFCKVEVIEFIKQLLYRYDCVILPDFGAFLAQRVPAKLSASHKIFYPPHKKLSFNQQIVSNDGLLANYVSKKKQISYEQSNLLLQEFVVDVKDKLQKTGRYTFNEIGIFTQQANQKLIFEPLHTNNYLKEAFGLANLRVNGIFRDTSEKHKEVINLDPEIETNKVKPYYYFRRFIAASVILGGIYTIYKVNPYAKYIDYQNSIALEQSKKEIKKDIQSASFSLDIYDTLTPIRLSSLLSKEDRQLIDDIRKRTSRSADVELTSLQPFKNVDFIDEDGIEESRHAVVHHDSLIYRANKLLGVKKLDLDTDTFENFDSEIDLDVNDAYVNTLPKESVGYKRTTYPTPFDKTETITPKVTKRKSSSVVSDKKTTAISKYKTSTSSVAGTGKKDSNAKTQFTKKTTVLKKYYIVAGVYSSKTNAMHALDELKDQGLAPTCLEKDKLGKYKVAYATGYSKSEANKLLKTIQIKYNKDAWLFISE